MTKIRNISAVAIAALVIGSYACTSDRIQFAEAPGPPPFDSTDASPALEASTCGALRCSRDLRKVLRGCDGADEVVEECGVDQGCGDGRCVDACTSAESSRGSLGCSFWTVPPEGAGLHGDCFAAMVANTWTRPVALRAELGVDPLDISKSTYTVEWTPDGIKYTPVEGALPPGEVAVVFLAQGMGYGCPSEVTYAYRGDPLLHGTRLARAFHLTTDAPVGAYSIYPYGGGPSAMPTATLLLPVSSWTTNYLAVMPGDIDRTGDTEPSDRTLQIIANENDTEVRLRPKIPFMAGADVVGATPEEPGVYKLSRGQVLQFRQFALEEATGSPIESSKPIGVFGGSDCTFLPSSAPWCDVLQQQIPPLAHWGTQYALVPYRPRFDNVTENTREVSVYTLVGATDGTVLTYDPVRPRYAPETLSAGETVTFKMDELVTVRSQDKEHPFYAAVYMTASTFKGTVDKPHSNATGTGLTFPFGDPDFVNLVSTEQYLDRYVFFADYTYPETAVTVVRRKTANGFMPVELDCAGTLDGFHPIGTSGEFEYAWVRLMAAGAPVETSIGSCSNGRHEAKSDGPFSITVWGTDVCASYGYAGGTGLRPLNDVVVPVR